jgi:predicted GNAT superfamily acetyltransferase
MAFNLPVRVRRLVSSDENLILNTWIRSDEPDARINKAIFFREREICIKRLFLSYPQDFRVAVDPDDSEHVYGWVCGRYDGLAILDYIFVKTVYRKLGMATMLLQELFGEHPVEFTTCLTAPFLKMRLETEYDPFLARGLNS